MWVEETPLPNCYIVHTTPFSDHRGMFTRFFCEKELNTVLENKHIVNVNFSYTKWAGSIRGMHYQIPPYAEMKLVRCIKGRIFDVAIDIRMGSNTFLQWYGVELSAENMDMFVIPEGFAHGFQALSNDVEMLYLHTEFYAKGCEKGINCLDQKVNIIWPQNIVDVSEKDAAYPFIDDFFSGVKL